MPRTQPRCYKWQESDGHNQQPGATGFCWLFEGGGYSEKDRLPRELTIHLNKWSEHWDHAEGEHRAGEMLQSETAADPSTRALPKLGFDSPAKDAGSFDIKHSFPSGSAFIPKAHV